MQTQVILELSLNRHSCSNHLLFRCILLSTHSLGLSSHPQSWQSCSHQTSALFTGRFSDQLGIQSIQRQRWRRLSFATASLALQAFGKTIEAGSMILCVCFRSNFRPHAAERMSTTARGTLGYRAASAQAYCHRPPLSLFFRHEAIRSTLGCDVATNVGFWGVERRSTDPRQVRLSSHLVCGKVGPRCATPPFGYDYRFDTLDITSFEKLHPA